MHKFFTIIYTRDPMFRKFLKFPKRFAEEIKDIFTDNSTFDDMYVLFFQKTPQNGTY